MVKKLKVGLVMGGGVSLGAFNGGAIAEIVKQLHSNLNDEVYEKAEIDVLSGASAGGMTLGLLLRVLANPENLAPQEVVKRVGKTQWDGWVDKIELGSLIRTPEMTHASLLDRQAVDDLARSLIRWDEGEEPHPVLLANRVCLSITLLNYNGIPILTDDNDALKDPMSTTLYRDYRCFCLDFGGGAAELPDPRWLHYGRDRMTDPDAWYEIAATAVAGGAFPLAFEPVAVSRRKEEYAELWPDDLKDRDEFCFSFGDGGTFDNEPLQEATRMASLLDAAEEDPESFDRILIYVDPILSGTNHDFSLSFNVPLEIDKNPWKDGSAKVVEASPGGRFLAVATRLAAAVRSQAAYKDFLAADKLNRRLEWRESLREQLRKVVEKVPESEARALANEAENKLHLVLNQKKAKTIAARPGLNVEEEVRRVRTEMGQRRGLEASEATDREDLVGILIALVDHVSGLSARQEVQIVAIGPTEYDPPGGGTPIPVELTGDFRNNFGGFLLHRFREHDYQAGAAMAGSVFASVKGAGDLYLLRDRADRSTYTEWGGEDPGFDAVPKEEKDRLVGRAGEVAQQVVQYLFRNRRLGVAIGFFAERLADHFVPKALSDPLPTEETTVLELVITSPNPGRDEFYLAGQGGGLPTAHVRSAGDSQATIRTLVRYSEAKVSGPHVVVRNGEWHVQLQEHQPLAGDPLMFVRLPPHNVLAEGQKAALPVYKIEIDWANQTCGEWRLEDRLTPLAMELPG